MCLLKPLSVYNLWEYNSQYYKNVYLPKKVVSHQIINKTFINI